MNLITCSLILLVVTQIIVGALFIARAYFLNKQLEKDVNVPELIEEIKINRKEFLQILNTALPIYNLSEVERFLTLDAELFRMIQNQEIRPCAMERYNNFIVSSTNLLGSKFFDFYESSDYLEDIMCI